MVLPLDAIANKIEVLNNDVETAETNKDKGRLFFLARSIKTLQKDLEVVRVGDQTERKKRLKKNLELIQQRIEEIRQLRTSRNDLTEPDGGIKISTVQTPVQNSKYAQKSQLRKLESKNLHGFGVHNVASNRRSFTDNVLTHEASRMKYTVNLKKSEKNSTTLEKENEFNENLRKLKNKVDCFSGTKKTVLFRAMENELNMFSNNADSVFKDKSTLVEVKKDIENTKKKLEQKLNVANDSNMTETKQNSQRSTKKQLDELDGSRKLYQKSVVIDDPKSVIANWLSKQPIGESENIKPLNENVKTVKEEVNTLNLIDNEDTNLYYPPNYKPPSIFPNRLFEHHTTSDKGTVQDSNAEMLIEINNNESVKKELDNPNLLYNENDNVYYQPVEEPLVNNSQFDQLSKSHSTERRITEDEEIFRNAEMLTEIKRNKEGVKEKSNNSNLLNNNIYDPPVEEYDDQDRNAEMLTEFRKDVAPDELDNPNFLSNENNSIYPPVEEYDDEDRNAEMLTEIKKNFVSVQEESNLPDNEYNNIHHPHVQGKMVNGSVFTNRLSTPLIATKLISEANDNSRNVERLTEIVMSKRSVKEDKYNSNFVDDEENNSYYPPIEEEEAINKPETVVTARLRKPPTAEAVNLLVNEKRDVRDRNVEMLTEIIKREESVDEESSLYYAPVEEEIVINHPRPVARKRLNKQQMTEQTMVEFDEKLEKNMMRAILPEEILTIEKLIKMREEMECIKKEMDRADQLTKHEMHELNSKLSLCMSALNDLIVKDQELNELKIILSDVMDSYNSYF